MADATFAFELVSPERLLLSEPARLVVVPGEEGDFGVLAGHSPFISTLRPGTINLFEGGRVTKRIFVAGGFAEVMPERCTILAEEAEDLAQVDRAALEAKIKDLTEDAREAASEAARAAARRRLDLAQAKLEAIDRPTYK